MAQTIKTKQKNQDMWQLLHSDVKCHKDEASKWIHVDISINYKKSILPEISSVSQMRDIKLKTKITGVIQESYPKWLPC